VSVLSLRSGGAILCFHGIASPAVPGQSESHLSLAEFRTFIEAARVMGQLVPLRELVRQHLAGRGTAGLIAITADDAYASLMGDAASYLAREAIPLTVFVVTQPAMAGAAYWWDRIDDQFPRVPRERWREFEDACGLTEAYRRGQPARYGPLRPFRQWMLATHQGRWPAALEPQLQSLERETGMRTAQRSMNLAELARFADLASVDIGVHTLSHPVLPLLSDQELRCEISAAYETLREHFPNAVPILAVPFGLFDRRTLVAAREAGMATSLTLAGTTLKRYGGRDDLPRFCLGRNDRAFKLRARLTGFFDRGRGYPLLPSATT
jgi:peptidoglycan/xylan/chitin deacetylase (PgdA/CDA1 family)